MSDVTIHADYGRFDLTPTRKQSEKIFGSL